MVSKSRVKTWKIGGIIGFVTSLLLIGLLFLTIKLNSQVLERIFFYLLSPSGIILTLMLKDCSSSKSFCEPNLVGIAIISFIFVLLFYTVIGMILGYFYGKLRKRKKFLIYLKKVTLVLVTLILFGSLFFSLYHLYTKYSDPMYRLDTKCNTFCHNHGHSKKPLSQIEEESGIYSCICEGGKKTKFNMSTFDEI